MDIVYRATKTDAHPPAAVANLQYLIGRSAPLGQKPSLLSLEDAINALMLRCLDLWERESLAKRDSQHNSGHDTTVLV